MNQHGDHQTANYFLNIYWNVFRLLCLNFTLRLSRSFLRLMVTEPIEIFSRSESSFEVNHLAWFFFKKS